MRNKYGAEVFGARELPATRRRVLTAAISDALRIGGDIRTQGFVYVDDSEKEGRTTRDGFFAMQTDLYAYWAISDRMGVYVEQDVLNGTQEVFGMYRPNGGSTHVKVGTFIPNYGVQMDDHTAFIRGGNPRATQADGLFWNPNIGDTGVEVGAEYANIEWTFGTYNGSQVPTAPDPDNDKAFLARAELYGDLGSTRALVGGNVYANRNQALDVEMLLAGGFLGFGGDSWTLMAEVDFTDNYLSTGDPPTGARSLALFTEATYRLTRGGYILTRFERFDPDLDAASGEFWRASVGAEIYPVPGMELKPTFRFTSQPKPEPNLAELLIQAHWWF